MINKYTIGVVGAGGFAKFALKAFLNNSEVKFGAVYDINIEASKSFANNFNGKSITTYNELLDSDEINIVYIATPPYLHYEQSLQALKKGKHVICEKPVAFKYDEAVELNQFAKSKDLLFIVNLMQRYNPLFLQIKQLFESNVLGEFLHGYMENYASDQSLHPNHWFWDEKLSGGIFIEHGVHFFDLFAGWLGKGELITSIEQHRKKTAIEYKAADRVQAIVRFPKGIVNYYHGFNQPDMLDRQEFRLQFEKGELTLFEWVPTRFELNAVVTQSEYNKLINILSPDSIKITERFSDSILVKGNFKDLSPDLKINISGGEKVEKEDRYIEMLSNMINDQLNWIKNKQHKRLLTAQNAIDSIEIAINAHTKAIRL